MTDDGRRLPATSTLNAVPPNRRSSSSRTCLRSLNRERKNSALASLYQNAFIQSDRRGDDGAAVGRDARGERTVVTRQKMHVTLVIRDGEVASRPKRPAYQTAG